MSGRRACIVLLALFAAATPARSQDASTLKKDFSLKMLDPQGVVIEQWDIKGAWVQDANFSELDYASSDNLEVAITLRYDSAVHLF